jgi:hypothetical protein
MRRGRTVVVLNAGEQVDDLAVLDVLNLARAPLRIDQLLEDIERWSPVWMLALLNVALPFALRFIPHSRVK